mmetsp:Transcript_41538/g.125496  ORF Transcript_41538/g.125496 Transcript_41538/m.125496 type:complete len:252 (-) Transcript_41538:506-1261(-)
MVCPLCVNVPTHCAATDQPSVHWVVDVVVAGVVVLVCVATWQSASSALQSTVMVKAVVAAPRPPAPRTTYVVRAAPPLGVPDNVPSAMSKMRPSGSGGLTLNLSPAGPPSAAAGRKGQRVSPAAWATGWPASSTSSSCGYRKSAGYSWRFCCVSSTLQSSLMWPAAQTQRPRLMTPGKKHGVPKASCRASPQTAACEGQTTWPRHRQWPGPLRTPSSPASQLTHASPTRMRNELASHWILWHRPRGLSHAM